MYGQPRNVATIDTDSDNGRSQSNDDLSGSDLNTDCSGEADCQSVYEISSANDGDDEEDEEDEVEIVEEHDSTNKDNNKDVSDEDEVEIVDEHEVEIVDEHDSSNKDIEEKGTDTEAEENIVDIGEYEEVSDINKNTERNNEGIEDSQKGFNKADEGSTEEICNKIESSEQESLEEIETALNRSSYDGVNVPNEDDSSFSSEEGHEKKQDPETNFIDNHLESPDINQLNFSGHPQNGKKQSEFSRIYAELPRVSIDKGKEMHFFRVPNFLNIERRRFDPHKYENEIEDEKNLDEEGLMELKLKVGNTIRWRKTVDDHGKDIVESNARIVKWSDGSYSLHIGSEIFDVHLQNFVHNDNQLFIFQEGLAGQAVFRSMLTCRPHSPVNYTHKLASSVLRNEKLHKIRVLPKVGNDPEAHKSEQIKAEEQKLKASASREKKQRKIKDKYYTRLSASFLEPDTCEDEDDGAISISNIKKKYQTAKQARVSANIFDETSGSKEILEKLKQSDQEKDDDDDSDLDYLPHKKTVRKRKTAIIEESDED